MQQKDFISITKSSNNERNKVLVFCIPTHIW